MNEKNNFYAAAEEITAGSDLLRGREKLSTTQVIMKYPEGVTVIGFDLLTGKRGTPFAACIIKEDPGVYFNGGKTVTEIVSAWLRLYDGDLAKCNYDLSVKGGVKMRLIHTTTKDGRDYIRVQIINPTTPA